MSKTDWWQAYVLTENIGIDDKDLFRFQKLQKKFIAPVLALITKDVRYSFLLF
jgi:hypothetical protein